MKVVVVTLFTTWSPHYETELEVMQQHLDQGDEVVHLHCDGELLSCDFNPDHDYSRCRDCKAVRKAGIQLLSNKLTDLSFLNLSSTDRHELASTRKSFATTDELAQHRIGDFDLGYAVLSSLISLTRNPKPDLQENGKLVPHLLVSALSVYRSLQNYLDQHKVDRVYVFNGRFAVLRAVLRACQNKNIPCYVHERGHDVDHFALFENTFPHDLRYIEQSIERAWHEAAGDPKRDLIGEQFFTDRAKGLEQSWYSFVKGQQDGLLPPDWNPTRTNIAIFNSSEDEFAAIGDDWKSSLYANQQEGLVRILRSLSASPGNIQLYLRMHPNLKGVDNFQTRELARLKADFLKIIPPEAEISTYTLIRNADKVVTFGSTVGIEAVFWGAPSILLGPCCYGNLGGTYNPSTHEEALSLLKADLAAKPKEAALKYGYYMNTFGIPFRHFQATGVGSGLFKGVPLSASQHRASRFRIIRAIRRRMNILPSRIALSLARKKVTGTLRAW